ncbi:MAG: hypothetical protein WCD47_10580 [Candidatus Sulfotelmatobacter sp.]
MKHLGWIIPLFLLTASSSLTQVKPIPPGVRQADQTEAQTERNIPPPVNQRTHVDVDKLRRDADELARIAQTIPPDVAILQRGLLPKDMMEKLKRIEKLSKHLRSQIAQ